MDQKCRIQVYSYTEKRVLIEGKEYVIETFLDNEYDPFPTDNMPDTEPGPDTETIYAMLKYVKSQFPGGWEIVDGKVVNVKKKWILSKNEPCPECKKTIIIGWDISNPPDPPIEINIK